MLDTSYTDDAIRAIRDEFGDEPAIWVTDELIDVATFEAERMAEWDGVDGFAAEKVGEFMVHFTLAEGR